MSNNTLHKLGIDIGSTTVKVAVLDENDNLLFSDYERHFANIRETLSLLVEKAYKQLGDMQIAPMITGSGGLTLAKHLDVPFVQEVTDGWFGRYMTSLRPIGWGNVLFRNNQSIKVSVDRP